MMDPKEILVRDVFDKVGDKISEQTTYEKVSQFIKYGNVFLFFEVMNLKKEIERIKELIK